MALDDLIVNGKICNAQNAWVEIDSKLKINGDFQITGGHVVSSLNPSGLISLGSPTEVWAGINVTTAYVSMLSKLNGTSYI
jgi:hypothetical protein